MVRPCSAKSSPLSRRVVAACARSSRTQAGSTCVVNTWLLLLFLLACCVVKYISSIGGHPDEHDNPDTRSPSDRNLGARSRAFAGGVRRRLHGRHVPRQLPALR